MKYIPNKREHIVHIYRRDDPHGIERAVCGWRPPVAWHPRNRPAPLSALPDYERCPSCLDQIADEPHQLYALMPPEDWINWEGPGTSEPDPSGDPATTGPTDSKTGEVAARAYAKAQQAWNKTEWRVFTGLISLVIAVLVVVGVVASGGSDNSSSTPSGTSVANSAASASEATPKESKQGTPASIGQTGGLPLQDGDWRLESITVASDSRGDFVGSASITYTGGNPEGGDNLFTVTLRKDGKDVGTLQGKAEGVMPGDAATVQLASSDPWVEGPYTYDF